MDLLRTGMARCSAPGCTPGYYNNEGQPDAADRDGWRGYPMGAVAYFEFIDGWRRAGTFEGLAFG